MWIIAAFFIVYGVFVFKGNVPYIDHFLNYMSSDDPRLYKLIGSILVIIGVFVAISPFIFGIENMNY